MDWIRWFDKMFQLIFFKNGRAGLNGEHTPLDAPALVRFFIFRIAKNGLN